MATLIGDKDILLAVKSRINEGFIFQELSKLGVKFENWKSFFYRKLYEEQEIVDVGLLRYPDFGAPFFVVGENFKVTFSVVKRFFFVKSKIVEIHMNHMKYKFCLNLLSKVYFICILGNRKLCSILSLLQVTTSIVCQTCLGYARLVSVTSDHFNCMPDLSLLCQTCLCYKWPLQLYARLVSVTSDHFNCMPDLFLLCQTCLCYKWPLQLYARLVSVTSDHFNYMPDLSLLCQTCLCYKWPLQLYARLVSVMPDLSLLQVTTSIVC